MGGRGLCGGVVCCRAMMEALPASAIRLAITAKV
jgi:hypothetical protein